MSEVGGFGRVEVAVPARIDAALEVRFPTRMVPDLDRIVDLLGLLGDPQRAYPSIHLTGTNGKTSTARMIDSLLRQLGIRTGRYTSPHLESVTERICVDGEPLAPERFAELYDEVAPYAEIVDRRHPDQVTFFELLTAMGFAGFADAPVDVAVVEVGLGGRWDATNVIDAPVAVVTPISLDHVGILGDTVAEIAAEKAGLIHQGAAVVSAVQPEAAGLVLAERAAAVGATVVREGINFGVRSRLVAVGGQQLALHGLGGIYDEVFLPLYGEHQASNAACALAAVEAFLGVAHREPLDVDAVRAGFAAARSPGRMEVVRRSPTVLLDGAHNPAGAAALAAAVEEAFAFDRLVAVVAMLADKDAAAVLAELEPVVDAVVVTTNGSPRALPADALAAAAVEVFGADRVESVGRLDDAIERAVDLAESHAALGGAGVLVTGSIVTVGEARHLLTTGPGEVGEVAMSSGGPALPPRGLNAVGSAGLAIEAVVVLLAAAGVASLQRGHVSALGIGYILALAALLVVASGWLRRPGGKSLATVLQPLVVVSGLVTWPMYVVGLAFAGIWVYWLRQWPRQ